jgi:poly(hydroxyalkanoate) depolymerase family esterase
MITKPRFRHGVSGGAQQRMSDSASGRIELRCTATKLAMTMAMKLDRLMSAAGRLTRQGRLVEATTLLAGTLLRARERVVKTDLPRTAPAPRAPEAPVADIATRPTATSRALLDHFPAVERFFGDPPELKGSFLSATHAFGGMSRNYKLFVPSAAGPSPALVVMLHGCTQDADDFAAGTRMNVAAEAGGFLVLYPRQSREANASACWNWFGAQEQRGQGETAFLADLVRSVVADHRVDPARVYVAGLSAGGAMAANLAATHPALFAAVAVHSGLPAGAAANLPDALLAMRNGARSRPASVATAASVPTIVFHGDADRTVHPANAQRLIAAVVGEHAHPLAPEKSATGSPPHTRTRYVDAQGREVAELWELHGAGHAWAGGANAGTYTDPKGVDATGEMLRFFDAQRR